MSVYSRLYTFFIIVRLVSAQNSLITAVCVVLINMILVYMFRMNIQIKSNTVLNVYCVFILHLHYTLSHRTVVFTFLFPPSNV